MNTIRKTGKRVTVEIEEADAELIVSALRIAAATRNAGRKVVAATRFGREMKARIGPVIRGPLERIAQDTPVADQREEDLLALFERVTTN